MNINEAKEIFLRYYPNLPTAVKKAVKFTLENWDEMKAIPIKLSPFSFTVDTAKTFLRNLPALPTDARKEDQTFIDELNAAVNVLRGDLDVWLSLEDFPHEEWRDIIGYEGHYQVSNYGRVKSLKHHQELIMRSTYTKDGYFEASLRINKQKRRTSVHALVAQAFISNPNDKPQVNHEDANSLNNCFWNLNWVTNSENQLHAIRMGVKRIGSEFPSAKLTSDDVRYIRKHYIPRHPEFGQAALARKFNVSHSTIYDVIHYRSYVNIV